MNESLDHKFAALADPTRRAILARLALGEATVAELQAPFPGSGNDRTLRMYAFFDLGAVTGPDGGLAINVDANKPRSSVGIGVSWISPMGPLRLAFAKPIKKFESDKIQSMQFQIGSSF